MLVQSTPTGRHLLLRNLDLQSVGSEYSDDGAKDHGVSPTQESKHTAPQTLTTRGPICLAQAAKPKPRASTSKPKEPKMQVIQLWG